MKTRLLVNQRYQQMAERLRNILAEMPLPLTAPPTSPCRRSP